MTNLKPFKGYVLVQQIDIYDGLEALEETFNKSHEGILLKTDNEDLKFGIGKMVYWEEYQASTPVVIDDVKYTFVRETDIRGFNDEVYKAAS
jgi:hypothetical protein